MECPLVHHGPAAHVDQVRRGSHRGEDALVHEVRRGRRVGNGDHHEVRLRSEGREVGEAAQGIETRLAPPLLAGMLRDGRHSHPDEVRPARHFAPDSPEAHDQDAPFPQLSERAAAPHALPQVGVRLWHLAVQRGHRHEDVLGDAVIVAVDVRDAAPGRHRVQRDAVIARTKRLDQAEMRRGGRPLGAEDAVHEDVSVAEHRRDVVARFAVDRDDLGRNRQMVADGTREGRVGDDSKRRHPRILRQSGTGRRGHMRWPVNPYHADP